MNCYGFMSGDIQVIFGSMVGENRRLPASNETPVYCPPSYQSTYKNLPFLSNHT